MTHELMKRFSYVDLAFDYAKSHDLPYLVKWSSGKFSACTMAEFKKVRRGHIRTITAVSLIVQTLAQGKAVII